MTIDVGPHRSLQGFYAPHRQVAFVAPNATLIGEVEIGAKCGVWFSIVLRGDGPGVRIGENSNPQDGTVVHVAARGLITTVGRNVTSDTWRSCTPARSTVR